MSPRAARSADVQALLDDLYDRYNRPSFITDDPVSIPHSFARKEDREISAFLTATISWGNRKAILQSARRMMERMGESPYDFVLEARPHHLRSLPDAVHRTFSREDLAVFIRALRRMYSVEGGMEAVFTQGFSHGDAATAIAFFRSRFFTGIPEGRTGKHVADPLRGSSAKRINMFLRWMVRKDERGVDLGLWKGIPTSALSIPLDVHSGNTARELGLLGRTQNDWKAVAELDAALRRYDPVDPVRYDYALFGAGVNR